MPVLCASLNSPPSPKKATDSSGPKPVIHSPKHQKPRLHAVDKKHNFLHVKFEVVFCISFTRKCMFNKKVALFTGDGPSFFKKRELKNSVTFWFSELEDSRNT
jgi:hypothetical protein